MNVRQPPQTDEGERVLLKIYASKIFLPFSDDGLVIGENKVTRIRREFLSPRIIQTIQYADIMEVTTIETFWFCTLTMSLKAPGTPPLEIQNLKKSDAGKARRLIEGMVIAVREGINTAQYTRETITRKIEALGKIE